MMSFPGSMKCHGKNKKKRNGNMKPRVLLLAVSLVLIFGCASEPSIDKSAAGNCNGGRLIIHIGDSYMWITPRNFCVDSGRTFEATIQEHRGFVATKSNVRTISATSWLNNKTNSPDPKKIVFGTVTGDPGTEYKYAVDVPGVGNLDPAVRIR